MRECEEENITSVKGKLKHLTILDSIIHLSEISDKLHGMLSKITGSEVAMDAPEKDKVERLSLSYVLNNASDLIEIEIKNMSTTISYINEELFG